MFSADDGKLSLEEFQAFFSDGTLNEEELEKLFHTIDSDNTRSELSQNRLYRTGCLLNVLLYVYITAYYIFPWSMWSFTFVSILVVFSPMYSSKI